MKRAVPFVFIALLCFQGCDHQEDDPGISCPDPDLAINIDETIPATGCGIQDGVIRISAAKGTGPYTFFLNETVSKTGNFEGIASGVYTLKVKDARGCEAIIPNVVLMAEGLNFDAEINPDTECTGGNGSATISIHEGKEPFKFSLGEEGFASDNTFWSLKAGEYQVRLRDGDNCTSVLLITIPKGNTGTSWTDTIQPLIRTNCSVTGCHNGIARPDLSIYEKAKFYAAQMKTLTADRSMPFTGSLTQEQIDLIGCWVDEGALEN